MKFTGNLFLSVTVNKYQIL